MITDSIIQQNKEKVKRLIIEELQDDASFREGVRYALGVTE